MQSLYGAIANYNSNYMEKNKSKGLGDTVAKITKATGIKKIVDSINEARGVKDCGCKKRQQTLNRFFPYNK